MKFYCISIISIRGLARTQIPTVKNFAPEFPHFGEIASISHKRSAMLKPLLESKAFLITLSPGPGKLTYNQAVEYFNRFEILSIWVIINLILNWKIITTYCMYELVHNFIYYLYGV